MIRLWLHSMVAVALTCVLAVGVIVAQPRDDAEIHAFFAAPQGCASPCFLGIRPGATRADEAIALLRANPWVGAIKATDDGISWGWNGMQPAFVSTRYPTTFIDVTDGVVTRIRIATATTLGDFAFVFGVPDQEVFFVDNTITNYYVVRDAAYLDHGFEIETSTHCPFRQRTDLWYSTIFITWPSNRARYERPSMPGRC